MRGRAGERPVRHQRLLLQAEGAGPEHPAEPDRQSGGDPAARHRLHLRPGDGPIHKGETPNTHGFTRFSF